MTYATLSDLYSRYGQQNLCFLAEKKIDLNDERTEEDVLLVALQDASAVIDGFISARVMLPLDKVPAVLTRTACVLAYYSLADNVATEKAEKDKEDVLRFLEKVALGQISLGLTASNELLDEVGDVAQITSSGSVWNRKKSKGFI